jgi:hypothetical protein
MTSTPEGDSAKAATVLKDVAALTDIDETDVRLALEVIAAAGQAAHAAVADGRLLIAGLRALCDLADRPDPRGSYHLVVIPDDGDAETREFETAEQLAAACRDLIDHPVQVFAFRGDACRFTRTRPITLFTPEGTFVLGGEPEAEAAPGGYFGDPKQAPQPSKAAPAGAAQPMYPEEFDDGEEDDPGDDGDDDLDDA